MERRQMLKCLLAGGFSATLSAPLFAQQGAPRPSSAQSVPPRVANTGEGATGRAPRPDANVIMVDSKELERVLQDWERKTTKITRLRGTHQRYEYDQVFADEKRSIGKFWHESPDKGRIDFEPPKNLPKINEHKKAPNGQPYRIQPGENQTWMCDGKSIFQIEHTPKTYGQVEIPPQHQGENIMNGPLPFLFGMKADTLKQRYRLSLGSQHHPEGIEGKRPQYHVVAFPLQQNDARNWKRAEVILDAQFCLPTAIRLIDPGGTKETVYVFPLGEMKANERIWFPDPFKPSIRGYKIVEQRVAPPQDVPKGALGPAVQPVGRTKLE